MLPFRDAFNNDNPLSNLDELLTLNTWYAALFLVLGNLAGIAPFLYACKIGLYFLACSILASVFVSCFYHLCQTSHECFLYSLPQWVAMDHFTSTSMMGLLLLAFVNVRTVCQLTSTKRILKVVQTYLDKCGNKQRACDVINLIAKQTVYEPFMLAPDTCSCNGAHAATVHKHFGYGKVEENMIYDLWTAATAITILTITVMAVTAHPFSYAAFNIVIAVVVVLAFLKILLIDEGQPANFEDRISLPELIISIILSLIGLIAYVLDAYVEYMILHSVWHVAIYLGVMFLLAGTMRSVNGWVPLVEPCCHWIRSCCYPDAFYEDDECVEEEYG